MNGRNPYFCITIVAVLGAVAVAGTVGVVWVSVLGREPTQALVGVTSTAIGALGGALAVSPLAWAHREKEPKGG